MYNKLVASFNKWFRNTFRKFTSVIEKFASIYKARREFLKLSERSDKIIFLENRFLAVEAVRRGRVHVEQCQKILACCASNFKL